MPVETTKIDCQYKAQCICHTKVISEFRQGKFEQTIEGSLFMFPKPDGTNTVGKSTASNPGTPEAGRAFNQGSMSSKMHTQCTVTHSSTKLCGNTNFNIVYTTT
jgi:hypothetical protein